MPLSSQPDAPAQRLSSPSRLGPANGPLVVAFLLLVIALYAFPTHLTVGPVDDNDVWWHLRTGQWMVENGGVPHTDPFSAYGLGKDYVAYSWLYELAFYWLYQWLGLRGILLFRLVVVGALVVAIHRFVVRREPRILWSTALTALAFLALSNLLYERSWLFSMLFFLITLEVVERLRDGTAGLAAWLLPLVFALWVNLHVQFIYGLILLGLACVAPLGDMLLKRPTSGRWADTFGSPAWKRLVALTVACTLATLANPYFVHFYSVVLTYSSQKVPYLVENEFKSLAFRAPPDWAFLTLVLLAAVSIGRRLARISVFEVLLFAGTAFASFKARRDIWLLVFVSLAVCTGGATPALKQAPQFVFSWLRVAVVAAGVGLFGVFLARQRDTSEPALAGAVRHKYPEAAVEFIRKEGYPGPLFNDYDWGGYLIWALPSHLVSMDGRVHVHGDARLQEHFNTLRGISWDKNRELMTARLVLLPDAGPLPALLRMHPHFRLVYEDGLAVVFVARDEAKATGP